MVEQPPRPKREKLSSSSSVESHHEEYSPKTEIDTGEPSTSTPTVSLKPRKRRRIPYTLVEASKGNRCPTVGCDGVGHITGLYAMHFAVSGCPLAHGKTPDECRARREELNRLRSKNMPPEVIEESKPVRRTPRHASVSSVSSVLHKKTAVSPFVVKCWFCMVHNTDIITHTHAHSLPFPLQPLLPPPPS